MRAFDNFSITAHQPNVVVGCAGVDVLNRQAVPGDGVADVRVVPTFDSQIAEAARIDYNITIGDLTFGPFSVTVPPGVEPPPEAPPPEEPPPEEPPPEEPPPEEPGPAPSRQIVDVRTPDEAVVGETINIEFPVVCPDRPRGGGCPEGEVVVLANGRQVFQLDLSQWSQGTRRNFRTDVQMPDEPQLVEFEVRVDGTTQTASVPVTSPPECQFAEDCSPGEVCIDGVCVPEEAGGLAPLETRTIRAHQIEDARQIAVDGSQLEPGTHEVFIEQRFGRQQTASCGSIRVAEPEEPPEEEPAPEPQLSLATVQAPSTAQAGEQITIQATVRCDGDRPCSAETLTIEAAGRRVFQQAVSGGQRGIQTVDASVTFESGGQKEIVARLDGKTQRTTVTVAEPTGGYTIANVSAPNQVRVGQPFQVAFTARCIGGDCPPGTATISAAGETVVTRDIDLVDGGSRRIRGTVEFGSAGTQTVQLTAAGTRDTVQVQVTEAAAPPELPEEPLAGLTRQQQLAAGAAALLVVLLAAQ